MVDGLRFLLRPCLAAHGIEPAPSAALELPLATTPAVSSAASSPLSLQSYRDASWSITQSGQLHRPQQAASC